MSFKLSAWKQLPGKTIATDEKRAENGSNAQRPTQPGLTEAQSRAPPRPDPDRPTDRSVPPAALFEWNLELLFATSLR
ncbi:hypothetical protein CPLU01_12614 [Colletotrichum plurivorum]|uniref:Uncharacterized protein n=1 Tax=Colletotrichum plurivorum TaxID=2175906 RepID=A0A8H6N608_9PEZI|nr:hypothetical protein CPLU01_12614 [Colletotrichum plurivorum]